MDRSLCAAACKVRLFSIQCWAAQLHWQRLRDDGSDIDFSDDGAKHVLAPRLNELCETFSLNYVKAPGRFACRCKATSRGRRGHQIDRCLPHILKRLC